MIFEDYIEETKINAKKFLTDNKNYFSDFCDAWDALQFADFYNYGCKE